MSYSSPDIRISSEELQELYAAKRELAEKRAEEASKRRFAEREGDAIFETLDGLRCLLYLGKDLSDLWVIVRPCREPISAWFTESAAEKFRPLPTRKYVYSGAVDFYGRRIYREEV